VDQQFTTNHKSFGRYSLVRELTEVNSGNVYVKLLETANGNVLESPGLQWTKQPELADRGGNYNLQNLGSLGGSRGLAGGVSWTLGRLAFTPFLWDDLSGETFTYWIAPFSGGPVWTGPAEYSDCDD